MKPHSSFSRSRTRFRITVDQGDEIPSDERISIVIQATHAFFTETRPVAQLAPKPLIKVRRRPIFPLPACFTLSHYVSIVPSFSLSIARSSFVLCSSISLLFSVPDYPASPYVPSCRVHTRTRRTFWQRDATALPPTRLRITDTA